MVFGTARQLLQQKKVVQIQTEIEQHRSKKRSTPCGDERLCSSCLWKHGLRR
jgi:hypothetical protein